jgi:predicted dienelactone hydrolase
VRIFEILILLALLLALIGYFLPTAKRPGWLRIQPILAIAFALVHAATEGTRWQLFPAYALTGILCLLYLKTGIRSVTSPDSPVRLRFVRIAAGLGVLAIALSAGLATVLPVFEIPKPTGRYVVGTTWFHWTDNAREEPFTPDSNDHRQLFVQAWYPAEPPDGMKPMSYMPEASKVFPPMIRLMLSYIRQRGGAEPNQDSSGWAPTFMFNHVALVRSHSYRDAPFSKIQSACPVLVFSHGYLVGHVRQNTALMEHLASHGYVIFSIAHPHETLFWTDSDGNIVPLDHDNPLMKSQRNAVLAMRSSAGIAAINAILAAPTPAERDKRLRAFLEEQHEKRDRTSERLWLEDTRFVVGEAAKLNAGSHRHLFNNRLDLSKLGVLGMSYGGRLVPRFCAEDNRCRAGLDLDGGLPFLDSLDNLPSQPMMVFYPAGNDALYDLFYGRLHGRAYRVSLQQASHFHFMEFAIMLNPTLQFRSIRPSRALQIINDYALAFFDKELRGKTSPLLTGPSPYPEAIFKTDH